MCFPQSRGCTIGDGNWDFESGLKQTETVNVFKESVEEPRHNNFLKLGKRRERDKKRVAQSVAAAEAEEVCVEFPAEVVVQLQRSTC